MRIRKNWLSLDNTERERYLEAVVRLKATIANPTAPVAQRYSLYDRFVVIHMSLANVRTPFAPTTNIDGGHAGYHFLPWHRKFLLEFENALNAIMGASDIAIPWWDWTDTAGLSSDLLVNDAFGPNGTGASRVVSTGYFAPTAPAAPPTSATAIAIATSAAPSGGSGGGAAPGGPGADVARTAGRLRCSIAAPASSTRPPSSVDTRSAT